MERRSLMTLNMLAGIDASVKTSMRIAAKEDHRSRDEIVDSMNELAETTGVLITGGNAKRLTLATFEKWLSPTATDQLPSLRALVVFCEVVGSISPLSALAEPLGGRVIDSDQAAVLRLAEIEQEIKKLKKEKRKLEARS